MIRFICVVLFVILFLICSIPLLILEWILGHFYPEWKNKSSLAIIRWAFGVCLWFSGVQVTVLGEENIPADQSVLFVANHRSYFDILLTYVRMKRPCGFVAKKEMARYPLLSNWMRNIHCLFLDRKDIKQGLQTILAGIDKLKSGISIFIFPEGTRNKSADTFLPFHAGSFKLAEKSGSPIIPIAINNAGDIFEDHLPKIKKTHVVMEYGKPIYPKDLDREAKKNLANLCLGQIQSMYEKNKALV
ncbi:MAG: 1-acyl-sn-glycerol-3-phosphate acyltransferase [Lachnospiraceae bacterium]|nr:1-acyl-sn-glycerol-3-phosphate acyltransferase [Lachnospiraceae bacterium]